MSTELQQICTFLIDGRLFGIEVEHVQEIIRSQQLTPIPLAPDEVRGLINLRGQIVPAIDVRRCLGLDGTDELASPTNVVLRTVEGAISFLVDDIGDVLEVDPDTYEAPPDHLRSEVRALMRGVYKLDDGLLAVLVTDAIIEASTRALSGGALLEADGTIDRVQTTEPTERNGTSEGSDADPKITGDA